MKNMGLHLIFFLLKHGILFYSKINQIHYLQEGKVNRLPCWCYREHVDPAN